MSKKRAKKKPTRTAPASTMPSAAEQLQAARRETRQLRELKALMNQIRRKRLDNEAEGVALARVLVASTEFLVMSEFGVKELEHDRALWKKEVEELRAQLDVHKRELNPETV
jgi:hypothetical protein